MKIFTCIATFACVCVIVLGDNLDDHCANKTNGNYDIGCLAYVTCTGGHAHQVYCTDGRVYNLKTGRCDDPIHVPEPCGLQVDCTHKTNGRYADTTRHCRFFYTCNGGRFLGHNPCAGGLVFNETLGICDWARDVFPPCGTRVA